MKMEEQERVKGITMKPLQTEDVILDSYESNKDRPLKTLFAMYKGNCWVNFTE